MVYDGAWEGVEIYGCFCCFKSLLCVQPVSFVFIAGSFVVRWRGSAVRDLLDRGVVEAGQRPVYVNEESMPC